MALSKTQKRTDNNIRKALTHVCEQSLENIAGFEWLTHQADYTHFPGSLFITCVFTTEQAQTQAAANGDVQHLHSMIIRQLLTIGVKLPNAHQQIILDNEEACAQAHNGNWKLRLASRQGRQLARNRPLH